MIQRVLRFAEYMDVYVVKVCFFAALMVKNSFQMSFLFHVNLRTSVHTTH